MPHQTCNIKHKNLQLATSNSNLLTLNIAINYWKRLKFSNHNNYTTLMWIINIWHQQLPNWFPISSYVATFIAYSNSAFNPIIYGGFSKNFRDALYAILIRCTCDKNKISRLRKSNTNTINVLKFPFNVFHFKSRHQEITSCLLFYLFLSVKQFHNFSSFFSLTAASSLFFSLLTFFYSLLILSSLFSHPSSFITLLTCHVHVVRVFESTCENTWYTNAWKENWADLILNIISNLIELHVATKLCCIIKSCKSFNANANEENRKKGRTYWIESNSSITFLTFCLFHLKSI